MSSKPVTKPAAKPAEKRRYNSSRRTAQAAQTRADVLTAAVECFSESGWAGTTLNAIAERADVAVETVYDGFGSKKQLLREAFEIAVVGDAEPIPLVDRPEWADMHAGTRAQRIAKAVALNAEIHVRSARVWRAILESSTADAEMAAWRDELESNRHHDMSLGLEIVLGKPVAARCSRSSLRCSGPSPTSPSPRAADSPRAVRSSDGRRRGQARRLTVTLLWDAPQGLRSSL